MIQKGSDPLFMRPALRKDRFMSRFDGHEPGLLPCECFGVLQGTLPLPSLGLGKLNAQGLRDPVCFEARLSLLLKLKQGVFLGCCGPRVRCVGRLARLFRVRC